MLSRVAWVLALVSLACGTPNRAEQGAVPMGVALAAPERSAELSAAPSASASSSVPVSRAPLPARATTPGKIQCETVDCDLATELCCATETHGGEVVGECVPKPPQSADGRSPWVCGEQGVLVLERSCDEAADCAAGQQCCTPLYDESNLKGEYCDTICGGERCLAGSTCSNGNECAVKDGQRGGECPLQIKAAKCGNDTCKLGERCCWDTDAQKGACAKECGDDKTAWFACTGPEQCARSYACNTWPGIRQFQCGGSGFQGGVLCRTVKDCPQHLSALGSGPGAPQVTGCKHSKDLPPGVKECVYD